MSIQPSTSAAQMLVRLYPDVVGLKPAAMVMLAATNDIARNNGPVTLTMIEENIMAMTELAQLHGIRVPALVGDADQRLFVPAPAERTAGSRRSRRARCAATPEDD